MTSYYGHGVGTSAQPILATLKSETRLVSSNEAMVSDDFAMARKLYEFWQSLAPGIPQSNQLKFGKLDPSMMSNMVILDILDGGKDYQWRLFGTTHADQYGEDLTGCVCLRLSATTRLSMHFAVFSIMRQPVQTAVFLSYTT